MGPQVPPHLDPERLWRERQTARRYMKVQAITILLMVVGWFFSTFLVNPTSDRVDRNREERLEFQCRIERRLNMEEVDCVGQR